MRRPCFLLAASFKQPHLLRQVAPPDGLQLLDDETLISADGTHPDARGQEQIAARWSRIMAETLANRTAR